MKYINTGAIFRWPYKIYVAVKKNHQRTENVHRIHKHLTYSLVSPIPKCLKLYSTPQAIGSRLMQAEKLKKYKVIEGNWSIIFFFNLDPEQS